MYGMGTKPSVLLLSQAHLGQTAVQESMSCVEPRESTQQRGAMMTAVIEHGPQTDRKEMGFSLENEDGGII